MDKVKERLEELISRYPKLREQQDNIWRVYQIMAETFGAGGKLLVAGNGGSAADSEHLVGELMKGFVKTRKVPKEHAEAFCQVDPVMGEALSRSLQGALPAISLVGHVGLSTAYLNDCDPLLGFAQQVYGFGQRGDVFLGISTSGNSKNILYALVAAKARGLKTIGLTGREGGKMKALCDGVILAPEQETFKIQELHLPIYHTLCLMLEEGFFGND